jgi:hypothetical protein
MSDPIKNNVSVSECAQCHTRRRPSFPHSDPSSRPYENPVHAIEWPKGDKVDASKCHAYKLWSQHWYQISPVSQYDPWQVKRNYIDAARTDFSFTLRNLKARACIDLSSWNGGLGPWYTKLLARLTLSKGAKICFNLRGNHKGIVFEEIHNPIATFKGIELYAGVPFRYENAWFKEVSVYNDTLPLLKTKWEQCDLFVWCEEEELLMNPLRQFGDKIPVYYRRSDGRRLTFQEERELRWHGKISDGDLADLPLLAKMVFSERLPKVITYDRLVYFINVWSKTWSKMRPPKDFKEKIARDFGKRSTQNLSGLKGSILVSPNTLNAPGFFAKFKNTDPPELQYVMSKGWPYRPDSTFMAKMIFKSGDSGKTPYHLAFESKAKLDQIYLKGFFDLGSTSADIKSKGLIDKNGSEFEVSIKNIDAKINPFNYGKGDPPLVSSLGGRLYDGVGTEFFPAGFNLTKKTNGDLSVTLNVNAKHQIKTSKGSFTVRGNLIANIDALWFKGKVPRIKAGRTHIEIKNFRIIQEGETKPMISNARLIVTDTLDARKILAVAHPTFRVGESGFIVRLEFDDLRGLGYQKGYVVGFIPVPRAADDRFYDPKRFSVQDTLNIAFGLVTKKPIKEIKGNLKISKIDKGIKVRGNAMAISGSLTRHLIKNGMMKIITQPVKKKDGRIERRWYVTVRADHLGLKGSDLFNPRIKARFSTSSKGNTIRLDMKRLIARYRKIRSYKISMGRGFISSRFKLTYNRRNKVLRIWNLRTYLKANHISSRGLRIKSRGRITSFDLDGYLAGRWRHNLITNKGRGWLVLVGDKEGDIHLRDRRGRRIGSKRLGRETPLFSDTRWIALRVDGVDKRGWINGQFCLRTDIDLMALRPMGVRHSDYFEWRMSHDNVATPAGILARSEKYYGDLMKGKLPSSGKSRAGDVCKKIFSRIK